MGRLFLYFIFYLAIFCTLLLPFVGLYRSTLFQYTFVFGLVWIMWLTIRIYYFTWRKVLINEQKAWDEVQNAPIINPQAMPFSDAPFVEMCVKYFSEIKAVGSATRMFYWPGILHIAESLPIVSLEKDALRVATWWSVVGFAMVFMGYLFNVLLIPIFGWTHPSYWKETLSVNPFIQICTWLTIAITLVNWYLFYLFKERANNLVIDIVYRSQNMKVSKDEKGGFEKNGKGLQDSINQQSLRVIDKIMAMATAAGLIVVFAFYYPTISLERAPKTLYQEGKSIYKNFDNLFREYVLNALNRNEKELILNYVPFVSQVENEKIVFSHLIQFKANEYELKTENMMRKEAGIEMVGKVGNALDQFVKEANRRGMYPIVTIIGHTDGQPTKKEGGNLLLSQQRAVKIAERFKEKGLLRSVMPGTVGIQEYVILDVLKINDFIEANPMFRTVWFSVRLPDFKVPNKELD